MTILEQIIRSRTDLSSASRLIIVEALSQPLDPIEAGRVRGVARQYVSRHDHGPYPDRLTRENCQACACASDTPNVAGWERVFVEAERPIKLRALLQVFAHGRNVLYLVALARSIATFKPACLKESA